MRVYCTMTTEQTEAIFRERFSDLYSIRVRGEDCESVSRALCHPRHGSLRARLEATHGYLRPGVHVHRPRDSAGRRLPHHDRRRSPLAGPFRNAAVEKGQAFLQPLQGILAERGTDVTASLVQFEEPLDPKTITTHLLKIAAEQEYGTVVVGWHSFSGLRRLFRHQLARSSFAWDRG
jgi:hypothetical protein